MTGHVDWAALDRLTDAYLATRGLRRPSGPDTTNGAGLTAGTPTAGGRISADQPGSADAAARCGCNCGGCACPAGAPLSPQALARLRMTMLRLAADVMSGPGGLASWLRTAQLTGGLGASPSLPLAVPLPLDTGETEPAIPPHLRRAVLTRHRSCCFPGCEVPATACQIHHFVSVAATMNGEFALVSTSAA